MTGDPPPVVAWELCDYENQMMPVGHECVGDGKTPCPTSEGHPCGICPADLAAQEEYLKRAAQVADLQRYGMPGDLPDNPLT